MRAKQRLPNQQFMGEAPTFQVEVTPKEEQLLTFAKRFASLQGQRANLTRFSHQLSRDRRLPSHDANQESEGPQGQRVSWTGMPSL